MKTNKEDIKTLINWLKRHMRSQRGKKPSLKTINLFKKNNWLYTGYIYRGIHWGPLHKPYTSPKGKFKIGDKFTETKDFSSWTKSMRVAASFAAVGAYDNFVISDNPYFTLTQRACEGLRRYGGAGIIIRAVVTKGLDIKKVINAAEKTELGNYMFERIPDFNEKEVLVLKPISGEILKHYHPDLCK